MGADRRLVETLFARFRRHLSPPGPTLEGYKTAKRQALGEAVLAKARIYLDTNRWIGIRDHLLGKSDEPRYGELKRRIQSLVDRDLAAVPLTAELAEELFRQSDSGTRNAMAQVMDQLCKVGILPFRPRQVIEIAAWLRSFAEQPQQPLASQVWTIKAFIYGEPEIALPGDRAVADAAKKTLDDAAEHMSFAHLVSQIGIGTPDDKWRAWAKELSGKKVTEWKDDADFETVFIEESLGYWNLLWDVVAAVHETDLRSLPMAKEAPGDALKENTMGAVMASIRRGQLQEMLPGMQILAGGNARIRIERGRRFKPGDGPDLFHATAALPYCSLFFTDSSLRHLVSTPPTDFAARFDCRVLSGLDDMLVALERLHD